MNTEDIKKWMEEKGFDNSALAIDSSHRVSLYLSDVLGEFNEMLVKTLTIPVVVNNEANYCTKCNKPIQMINNTLQLLCECDRSEVKLFCDFDDGKGSVNCPVIGNIECEDCRYLNTK